MVLENAASLVHGEGVRSSFDVQAMIAQLLSDTRCNSVELPKWLTPAERKLARSIVDQHPELKSESYGFGADRRCHLFKRSATTSIRVKNTFIDGWDAADSSTENEEPIIVRSMPDKLIDKIHKSGNGVIKLPPLRPLTLPCPSGHDSDATSSTDVDADISCLSPVSGTLSDNKADDQKAVTVPPGVFRYAVGTRVMIQGLVKLPSFNGRIGIVHSLNDASGRYDVLLASPASGRQWAKVKYENLRPANCAMNGTSPAAA
jgi:hypothetical protein